MPAAVITRDDANRIRRNLERRGAPVPDALKDTSEKPTPEPGVGKEKTAPAVSRPGAGGLPRTGAGASPRSAPRRRPSDTPRRRPAGRGGGRDRRLLPAASRMVGLGGDGGGLLLAFWLYPLALAVLQHGIRGPGMWLRAKFLNEDETAQAQASSGRTPPATPASPDQPNPQPTYGGGGSMPARIA